MEGKIDRPTNELIIFSPLLLKGLKIRQDYLSNDNSSHHLSPNFRIILHVREMSTPVSNAFDMYPFPF